MTSAPFEAGTTSRAERLFVIFLNLLLGVAFLYACRVLLRGLWQPLLDMHAFRQTQTAITVYWLVHGGPWLAYETPVLGAQWSIPFEFPVYQWIVAPLAMAGVPLDAAGRIISFLFYVATLWPMALLFRVTGLGRVTFRCTAILFMTAPLYLYWSRTFMPESCALFFSCLSLALLASFLQNRRGTLAVTALVAGSIATLAKATTFPAFAVIGGCLILIDLSIRFRSKSSLTILVSVVVPALIITLPMIVGFVWVYYSDQIKFANEFGRDFLTSRALVHWTIGSLQQRFSAALWQATIENRVLPDLFGFAALPAFVVVGGALIQGRFALGAVLALVGFLVPFLAFANLHIVHNYYQYANGIFALACVGIGLGNLVEGRRPFQYIIATVTLIAIVVGQIAYFRGTFLPFVTGDYSQDRVYRIAELAKERTPPNSSILVFGEDWASTAPYYAERKGLVVPYFTPPAWIDKIIADPQSYLDDRQLGGIVLCRDRITSYNTRAAAIEQFVAQHAVIGKFGDCELVSPRPK